jgi:hypothetical protein
MGTYTELVCAFAVDRNTPRQIIDILLYMTGQSDTAPKEFPEHPLFGETRWDYMLQGGSVFFDGDAHSTVRLEESDGQYRVTIRCNFENYDDEIVKFIAWVTPYIDALRGDFLGYAAPKLPRYQRCSIIQPCSLRRRFQRMYWEARRSIPTRG